MKIIVIGAGNIGLTTAVCFAEKGHTVFNVEKDEEKLANLIQGRPHFFERDLELALQEQIRNKNLYFTSRLNKVIADADVVFLAVGTPNLENGKVDLRNIEEIISEISQLPKPKTIVIRSTVPPSTHVVLKKKYPMLSFISSPEFLREGSALQDCRFPERIIVGSTRPDDMILFTKIYENFKLSENQFIVMDPTSAEMTKYAANIFLASRISLMNEFARICEKNGANIDSIKKGVGSDSRIGSSFLDAGIGYGGSCFPKDIDAFIRYSEELNAPSDIIRAVKKSNDLQVENLVSEILGHYDSAKCEKKISIWGASFKPETDDLREAPAIKIIQKLLLHGFKINIYDPQATSKLKAYFNENINIVICESAFQALENSHALMVATEWAEFKEYNLDQIKYVLKSPVIFDGRNIFVPEKMISHGFNYRSIGRIP